MPPSCRSSALQSGVGKSSVGLCYVCHPDESWLWSDEFLEQVWSQAPFSENTQCDSKLGSLMGYSKWNKWNLLPVGRSIKVLSVLCRHLRHLSFTWHKACYVTNAGSVILPILHVRFHVRILCHIQPDFLPGSINVINTLETFLPTSRT